MNFKPFEILLVEDNPAEVKLTQEAFKEGKIFTNLNVVNDGEKAMDYLKKRNGFANIHRPDLILLDLNLPKKDGREVLNEIKHDPDLRTIPVVVMTSSDSDEDILKVYNLHVNCYVKKPIDFEQFIKVVQKIEEFWFTVAILPRNNQ